jgi:hypothetical protein
MLKIDVHFYEPVPNRVPQSEKHWCDLKLVSSKFRLCISTERSSKLIHPVHLKFIIKPFLRKRIGHSLIQTTRRVQWAHMKVQIM